MFGISQRLFKALFPCLTECLTRRRVAKAALHEVRRRQRLYVRLRLEDLEERIVPDAYTFEHMTPQGLAASTGSYTNLANWWDNNLGAAAQTLPGAMDTADIPVGASCTLNSSNEYYLAGLTVEGSMTLASNLTVAADGNNNGDGSTTIGAGGSLLVGNPSDASSSPTFDTTTLSALGTVTVGAPSGGSGGTLDATTVGVGDSGGVAGGLNIGDPGSGSAGIVDVSGTLTDNFGAALNVGGVGSGGTAGSSGKLDVATLSTLAAGSGSAPDNFTINTGGEVDVSSSGSLGGNSSIIGILQADNIDAFSGADSVLGGVCAI
jgi:hypothetical protein